MIDLPWPTLLALALTLVLAYSVYGLCGFGANIVAMPLLAHLLPLRFAVPMLVLLDLCAGVILVRKNGRQVDWPEIWRLTPWLLLGLVIGTTLLAQASERLLLTLLGAFVLGYGLWSLLKRATLSPISTRWAGPSGLIGGIFTALYGTGGPIYTLYLARRLPDQAVLRATIGAMIFGNSLVRVALFAGTGWLSQPGLLITSLVLVPCALIGYLIGSRLHHHLPAQRAMQVVWLLLIAGGISLLWRAGSGR